MDHVWVAYFLFGLVYADIDVPCNDGDIFAAIGYDVSLNWTLGKTFNDIDHITVYHSSGIIAQIIDGRCETKDNLSTDYIISKDENEWVVSLKFFNVTEQSSGDYILQNHTPDPGKKGNISKQLMIIGKPSVKEVSKYDIYRAYKLSCNNPFGLHCFSYRWKVNGNPVNYFENATYIFSFNITFNPSHVTCQICWDKTVSIFWSEKNNDDSCSDDSDPYVVSDIFGKNEEKTDTTGHSSLNYYPTMISNVLIGFATFLIIIGVLLIIQWRKNVSLKRDSILPNQPVAILQLPTNGEMTADVHSVQNRPLLLPNIQEHANRSLRRQQDYKQKRNSKSLHNILDPTQDWFYTLSSGLLLPLMHSCSDTICTTKTNIADDYNLRRCQYNFNTEERAMKYRSEHVNMVKLQKMSANAQKRKQSISDESKLGAMAESNSQLELESFDELSQEHLYSTID